MSPNVSPTQDVDDVVSLGNGAQLPVTGSASIRLWTTQGQLPITNLLTVAALNTNLFSVGAACDNGDIDTAIFTADRVQLIKDGQTVAISRR